MNQGRSAKGRVAKPVKSATVKEVKRKNVSKSPVKPKEESTEKPGEVLSLAERLKKSNHLSYILSSSTGYFSLTSIAVVKHRPLLEWKTKVVLPEEALHDLFDTCIHTNTRVYTYNHYVYTQTHAYTWIIITYTHKHTRIHG